MIYTVTLNPSIDHYIFLNSGIVQNSTNRAEKSVSICGGKGINVSLVCGSLGVRTVCTGFCGGFTGEELERQLDVYGIDHRFVKINADTRINTKIVCGGSVTEINAEAPEIKREEINTLIEILSALRSDDTVVLSGSVPKTPGTLSEVLEKIKKSGARLIADTSGDALNECIKNRPYMIKPNRAELAAYFGCDEEDMNIPEYAEKLLSYVENIMVSDGERGAYFLNGNGCRFLPVTKTGYSVKNTTGAGDSMIAGYLYGEQTGKDPFICAVSAGSASAYSENTFDKNIFDIVIKSY